MRKNIFGRRLKRDKNERTALFKSLLSSLVLKERITTTEAKAKAIRPTAEKLVTKARKAGNNIREQLAPYLNNQAIEKMITSIAPRFTQRHGGYTRIVHRSARFSDNASMVLMEWVEKPSEAAKAAKPQKEAKKKAVKKIKAKKIETPKRRGSVKKEAK